MSVDPVLPPPFGPPPKRAFRTLPDPPPRKKSEPTQALLTKPKFFIVHGHHRGARTEVELFVHQAKKTPVVLKDESQPGEDLLDELAKKTEDVSFAIVIMTADDVGASKEHPDVMRDRARQNVVFEFGFLVHQLGKAKVFVLREEGVELPSDYLGVVYIPYDEHGVWKGLLAKAIKRAGLGIDVGAVI